MGLLPHGWIEVGFVGRHLGYSLCATVTEAASPRAVGQNVVRVESLMNTCGPGFPISGVGTSAYAPEKDALVWKIKSFPGNKVSAK